MKIWIVLCISGLWNSGLEQIFIFAVVDGWLVYRKSSWLPYLVKNISIRGRFYFSTYYCTIAFQYQHMLSYNPCVNRKCVLFVVVLIYLHETVFWVMQIKLLYSIILVLLLLKYSSRLLHKLLVRCFENVASNYLQEIEVILQQMFALNHLNRMHSGITLKSVWKLEKYITNILKVSMHNILFCYLILLDLYAFPSIMGFELSCIHVFNSLLYSLSNELIETN